jgi:leader peptidase (prepilin peptidase) / N-methyltransferase
MEIFFLSFFVLGLLVGSFLNVVLFRTERGENFVSGRSKCLRCNTFLSWFENIPLLSFLFLGGKCRHCKVELSFQYPAVEAATGVLFVGAAFFANTLGIFGVEYAAFLVWFCVTLCLAIIIFVYDLRYLAIPVNFLWTLCVSLVVYAGFVFFFTNGVALLPSAYSFLWGAFASGGFFFLLVFISKETWMGLGDVWIGAWAGALLGIELVQVFITLSFTLGALVGVTLLYRHKKHLKSEIPFAPYLLLAAILIVVAKVFVPEALEFLSPWFLATI